jgi:hypothetical protein
VSTTALISSCHTEPLTQGPKVEEYQLSSPSTEPVREPWAFLLGLPPVDDYLSFLVQASPGQNIDIGSAAARWRQAAAVIDELTESEVGAADGPIVSELPSELASQAAQYLNDPAVAASYAIVPARVGLVSLDDLIVFQRQINLRYAGELRAMIGDWDSTSVDLFNFCLAVDQPRPPINRMQIATNAFVFQSISTDARFLGAALVDASQVSGYVPPGRATSAVVLFVGYGVNALSVVNINGRLILNNASHRAYALKAAGATHVPAIVHDLTREHELALIPAVQQNRELYLQSPRPPMLKDYFNPTLHEMIEVPRRARQVRLQFGMEALDAPG